MFHLSNRLLQLNEESDAVTSREFTATTMAVKSRQFRPSGHRDAEKALRQLVPFFTLWPLGGEMAEWFKAHAWKACVGNTTGGSNPSLSATFSEHRLDVGAWEKLPEGLQRNPTQATNSQRQGC